MPAASPAGKGPKGDTGVGALGAIAALPSVVEAFYPLDDGTGTAVRDIVNARTGDLTTGTGYSWEVGGGLRVLNGYFKLPAMTHRCMIAIFETPEGGSSGYYFCSSSGEALGPANCNAATVPTLKMLSGHGIHDITRRAAGSGMTIWSGGGPFMPAAVFAATRTGTPVIGAANTAGSGPIQNALYRGIIILNDIPTTTDLRRILDFARAFYTPKGVYLTPFDAPRKAILLVSKGESTDEGTQYGVLTGTCSAANGTLTVNSVGGSTTLLAGHVINNGTLAGTTITGQLTGTAGGAGTYSVSGGAVVAGATTFYVSNLPIAVQNDQAKNVLINCYNLASNATDGRRMALLSTLPGYLNNITPDAIAAKQSAPANGWNVGYRTARNSRPNNGVPVHMLNIGIGSTYRLPGGDGTTTTSTNYTDATGGVKNVTAALSRYPYNMPGQGLSTTVHSQSFHRVEQLARKAGIGYTVVIFETNEGLNDAYIGDQAVTSQALYQGWLEDERNFIIADTGISNPAQVFIKPHHPTGVVGPVYGVDPDYPNTAVGISRYNALHNYIRPAIDAYAAAHPGFVTVLDGDNYTLNSLFPDWVHPSVAGYNSMGADIDTTCQAAGFYALLVVPAA